MKLRDIPAHLGVTATQLADLLGVKKQSLNSYLNNSRGRPSKFITELLAVANLNREEIIFPDRFDHPDGENPDSPLYWCNIALEALRQASDRGLKCGAAIGAICEAVDAQIVLEQNRPPGIPAMLSGRSFAGEKL